MSASETTQEAASAERAARATVLRGSPSIRLPVYAACTAIALLINYLLGADLPWDTLNYHLYSGFSALNDRFSQDYFAAGPPSYFNPYAFVPFYALIKAGLTPLQVSSALTLIHSLVFLLTFELAVCICPFDDRRKQLAYGACAVAMTFLNPILVQQIGTSYADVMTAVPVLGGWLLLANAVPAPGAARIAFAGLLLGAASALKLTNSIHAIAGCALLIMLPRSIWGRVRYGLGYAAALGLGFVAVAAPWSYRLNRMFGNPLFPLLNGVFRSPEFTTEPLRHFRFIPDSLAQALWRPFAIVDPVPMVQEELTAPDLRYAVLLVLGGVLVGCGLWKHLSRSSRSPAISSPPAPDRADAAVRTVAALALGFAADWGMWLKASGNGRYFLPMASVAAVLVVALIFRLFDSRPKVRNYVLAVLLGAQLVQIHFGANLRWNVMPWSRQWIAVEMPERLATEPTLFLTMGVQSNSFIAPYLAPGSGLVNFSGGYALGPEGASGARIEALMKRYSPHVRVLWRGPLSQIGQQQQGTGGAPVDDAISRFGLRVDRNDCSAITLHGIPPDPEMKFLNSFSEEPAKPVDPHQSDTSYLLSCGVLPDGTDRSAQIAREQAVDLVFDRVEDACPALFQPRRLRTEHYHDIWRRLYVNTDLVLLIVRGSVRMLNPVRGGRLLDLGPEVDWAKAPLRLDCGRRDGRYFANVLKSKDS